MLNLTGEEIFDIITYYFLPANQKLPTQRVLLLQWLVHLDDKKNENYASYL